VNVTAAPVLPRDLGEQLERPTRVLCILGPPGAGKRFTADLLRNHAPDVRVIAPEEALANAIAAGTRDAPSKPTKALVLSAQKLELADASYYELAPLSREQSRALFAMELARLGAVTETELDEDSLRTLGGLPLALRAAAGVAHLVGLELLRTRLRDQGCGWLTHEGRNVGHEAQATLAGLRDDVREAASALAQFSGYMQSEAAARLLTDLGYDALSVLQALREACILHKASERHVAMWSHLRDAARLVRPSVRARDAYLNECERLAHAYARRGPSFLSAADMTYDDYRDLHEVRRNALERGRHESWRALLIAEARYLETNGPPERLISLAEEQLAAPSAAWLDPRTKSTLLCLGGDAHGIRGALDVAVLWLERAAQLGRAADDPNGLAETLVLLGVRKRQRGELDQAEALAREAMAVSSGPGHATFGFAAVNLAFTLAHAGRADEALLENQRALACFEALGERKGQALALGNMGELCQDAAEFTLARRHLESAVAALRACHDQRYEAIYTYILATAEHELEAHDAATSHYAWATTVLEREGIPHVTGCAHAAWGVLKAELGDEAGAKASFDIAERILSRARHPQAHEAFRLAALQLGSLAERQDALRGHIDAASHEVRFAKRRLERSVLRDSPAASHDDDRRGTLIVKRDGTRFWRVGGGQSVTADLTRRGALRRILLHLATSGDAPQSPATLVRAGWPGERILEDAASTRLRVAISSLRKLGLADFLVTRDDGYQLQGSFTWRDDG
jgi:tetratricopeptide (TPR) repeat protein